MEMLADAIGLGRLHLGLGVFYLLDSNTEGNSGPPPYRTLEYRGRREYAVMTVHIRQMMTSNSLILTYPLLVH